MPAPNLPVMITEVEAQSTQNAPIIARHRVVFPRAVARRTFGFVLDDACRRYWAKWYHEKLHPGEPFPDAKSKVFKRAMRLMESRLPRLVYANIPILKPLYPRLVTVQDKETPEKWWDMFVLKDSQTANWNVDEAVIECVRVFLHIGQEQEPAWYYALWPEY
ncbi:hypothetical protein C8Q80DRAFT_1124920 [Daedaleopsis nitida]|nr:hypothetical protein C8Q80DRAFT_1124920 [Daedaleopsis nitida]